MEISVLNINGEDTGRKVKLNKNIFGIAPNDHAIYLDVKRHLNSNRQGTHKTKERAEITGSTKKIKRQKGTGTARAGSIKSPIFRGGGTVFGPRPRDYSFKLNKKVRHLARKSALSYKAKDKNIAILEDFTFEEAKTKNYLNLLKSLGIDGNKSVVVIPENDKKVFLSGRNIKNTKVALASELNTYDVLNSEKLVLCESSVNKLESILS